MVQRIVFMIDNSSHVGNWALLAISLLVGGMMVKERRRATQRGCGAGALALVGYQCAAIATYGQPDSMLLAHIVYRGVLSGGIVMGFAWMVFATFDLSLKDLWGQFVKRLSQIVNAFRQWRVRRRLAREKAINDQQWLELEKHRITEENRPETPQEREDRLERERLAAIEHELQRECRDQIERVQAVKDRIRYEANLIHKKALRPGKTFKRGDFDKLLSSVLNGDDIDLIEARAAQLFGALGGRVADPQTATENQSLEELAASYEQRRQTVRGMEGVDEEYKNFLITAINREEGQAIQRHLRSL